ncbi:uncharacterized protein IL334_004841 [Kwoniella shivajii]|uniref:Uncharacterized protein n=1 Tax=Kwoniella shivajii TaxID=564305 RepID=A0ABZ1D1G9_9TREE|nr:hypothetical protein IL334_004841 [Kwoniella shivajii]
MRFTHTIFYVLNVLAIGQSGLAAAVPKDGGELSIRSGKIDNGQTQSKNFLDGEKPLNEDLRDTKGDETSWLTSTIGSLAHTNKIADKMKQLDTKDGVTEAEFYLIDKNGNKVTEKVKSDETLSEIAYRDNHGWWTAGIVSAMAKLGDVKGLDGSDVPKKISAGDPFDAYHMLTGEKAQEKKIEHPEDKDGKKQACNDLYDFFLKATEQPAVFHTKKDGFTNGASYTHDKYYTLLSVTAEGEENDRK